MRTTKLVHGPQMLLFNFIGTRQVRGKILHSAQLDQNTINSPSFIEIMRCLLAMFTERPRTDNKEYLQ